MSDISFSYPYLFIPIFHDLLVVLSYIFG